MACPAQGSRTNFSYITETSLGVTPSGNFTEVPILSHSLALSKEELQGNDIGIMEEVSRHGNRMVAGDISVDLRSELFDAFLESALRNTWDNSPSSSPDILKIGETAKTFTLEDAASDISQYQLFTGCTMNTLNLSMAPNQMISATFGVMGIDYSIGGTGKNLDEYDRSIQPFDAYSGSLLLGDTGSAGSSAQVTSLDFTLTNNIENAFVIGSDVSQCLVRGRTEVTGSFTAHFLDDSTMNRFLNEVESALSVSVNDPTGNNEYNFVFPRIKINSANAPLEGQGIRLVNCEFRALRDDTEETSFYIERPDSNP
jgi:hypothetical protein